MAVVQPVREAPVLNQAPTPLTQPNSGSQEVGVEDQIVRPTAVSAMEQNECIGREEAKGEMLLLSVIPLELLLQL